MIIFDWHARQLGREWIRSYSACSVKLIEVLSGVSGDITFQSRTVEPLYFRLPHANEARVRPPARFGD